MQTNNSVSVSANQTNNSKEMVSVNNTQLVTTGDILAALSGFIKKDGVNFNKVTAAIADGNNILNVLADPTGVAGIAPQQVHHFTKFKEAFELPKRVRAPKRYSVQATRADINCMVMDAEGRVWSKLDYSDVNVNADKNPESGYQRQNQSDMSDEFHISIIAGRIMHDIVYVNLKWELAEGQEITPWHIELQDAVIDNGFYFTNAAGVVEHAKFMMRTPSQERLIQAIYYTGEDVAAALHKLGHDLRAYAKFNKETGIWKLDVVKAMKRFGLAGTNTIASQAVTFGSEIKEFENGEYMITGGRFNMYVAEERFSVIKTGKYKAFDEAVSKAFEVFDAAEHPVTLAAGDGLVFCDEDVFYALAAEFGMKSSAWQVRITPFTKGLMVFVPGLKKYYPGANIVAFKSAVKGDYRPVIENRDIKLRIALFNKPIQRAKKYTTLPYQFTHITSVSAEALIDVVNKHLTGIMDLFKDPAKMADYVGLPDMNDVLGMDQDEQKETLEESLRSIFFHFLFHAPISYKDIQMKKYAIEILKNIMKQWAVGSVPVDGHYRFMVQDPYAVLEAKKHNVRDEEGRLMIPAEVGLKPNTVFMLDDEDKPMLGQEVVMMRNPAIAKGEAAYAVSAVPQNYLAATGRGAFSNLCIMSVHDFATFQQGGADNDGDTTLATTERAIVDAVKRKNEPAILDMSFKKNADGSIDWTEGCPYSGEYDMSQFVFEFTNEEYNMELANKMLTSAKSFVKRTLEANEIGLLTNYATKLADGVRAIGYKIAAGEIPADQGKSIIVQSERHIDLLRLCQGWEIDKAKHGGAYKEALKDELSFIENPPTHVSKYNERLGRRTWISPDWMAARRGRFGVNTGSVLSRVHNYVNNWIKTNLDDAVANMLKDNADHNLLGELTSSIYISTDRFEALKKHIAPIKKAYGESISKAYQKEELSKQELVQTASSKQETALLEEKNAEVRASEVGDAVEIAQAAMTALEAGFTPEEIGAVAYFMQYAESKSDSTAFPWVAAKRQLLAACMVAAGTRTPNTIQRVAPSNFKVGMALLKGVSGKKVTDAINDGAPMGVRMEQDQLTGNNVFYVYVAGHRVGIVYNSALPFFMGDSQFIAKTAAATFNGKNTITVSVEAVSVFAA